MCRLFRLSRLVIGQKFHTVSAIPGASSIRESRVLAHCRKFFHRLISFTNCKVIKSLWDLPFHRIYECFIANNEAHSKTFIPSNPYQKGSSSSILYFLRNRNLTIRNINLTILSLKIRNFKRNSAMHWKRDTHGFHS